MISQMRSNAVARPAQKRYINTFFFLLVRILALFGEPSPVFLSKEETSPVLMSSVTEGKQTFNASFENAFQSTYQSCLGQRTCLCSENRATVSMHPKPSIECLTA